MRARISSTLGCMVWLAALGCGGDAAVGPGDSAVEACCEEPAAATGPLPDTSVWQLESTWRDGGEEPLSLASLRGRVTLMAMVFTHCAYACPRIAADLQDIVKELDPAQRADVSVVLVTFDHERDTPAVLRAWADDRGLDPAWRLLHGEADDIRELAAVLGVQYQRTPNGDYSHSNVITLLDVDGVVVHQQKGLNGDRVATLEALARLLSP